MDLLDEDAINIYVDGSSYSRPRRGGIGIRFVHVGDDGHEVTDDFSPMGYQDATNQEMELRSCIEALQLLKRNRTNVPIQRFSKILIHTDSQYVANNYDVAVNTWQSNGWRTRDGAPVVNADLWNQLIRAVFGSRMRVRFTWVKGHRDSEHNKAADKLAKASAKSAIKAPLHVGVVRRKRAEGKVQPRSVPMRGQRLTIRIISERYLPVQKLTQFRYEVVSRRSPLYKCVDFIYSDEPLKAGHIYRVRLNHDSGGPGLEKVFGEVVPDSRKP